MIDQIKKLKLEIKLAEHSVEALRHKDYKPKDHLDSARVTLAIAELIILLEYDLTRDEFIEELEGRIFDKGLDSFFQLKGFK